MLRKVMRYILYSFLLIILILGSKEGLVATFQKSQAAESLYVVRHTWHTGIIIPKTSITERYNIFKQTFPGVSYIEVGWGDYDFFRSDKATFGMAARAILWPTSSVLHIMPYYRDPIDIFPKEKIEEIELPLEELVKVLERIESSFEIGTDGNMIPLKAENPVGGRFYLSNEKYHLFKTCNAWTISVLKTGGIPVSSFLTFGPENVLSQLRKIEREK